MATNFLEGTTFLASPFNLMTTELNTLADANSATSSVGGSSGVFTQSNTSQGIWGVAHFKSGGTFTPAAGGYIAGWFLYSPDAGSTFEKVVSNTDMPRSPDFTIPLYNSAYASTEISQSSGIIRLPWWSWKLFVMSHVGASLPATANVIQLGSVAVQY